MDDLQISISTPTLYSDKKSVISIVNYPIQHDQMKYVRIDKSFVKHEFEEGGLNYVTFPLKCRKQMFFTKILPKPSFELVLGKWGMVNIYSST